MKSILTVSLLMLAGLSAFAQQKSKTDYMSVTILEFHGLQIGHVHNMIVTRTDSAQVQTDVDLANHGKLKEYPAYHERVLMSALQGYFNSGWKLVSTSVEMTVLQGSDFDKTYRYYLSREHQDGVKTSAQVAPQATSGN